MRKNTEREVSSALEQEKVNREPEGEVTGGNRLTRHWMAKLFCLLAAFGIWLYAVGSGENMEERTILEVPVALVGVSDLKAASDMSVIYGFEEKMDITVTGKKTDLSHLSLENVTATVDVSTLTEPGRYSLPVAIQLPLGVSAVNGAGGEGYRLNVYVDVNRTKQVPVRIANLNYVIDSSYHVGEPVLSVETVTVNGPAMVLDTVSYAGLSFDLGTVKSSMTVVAVPSLYGEDGNRISNPYVNYVNTEVVVKVPVYTERSLTLGAVYELPEMKTRYQVQFVPATVTVQGDPSVLNRMDTVVGFTVDRYTKEGEYTVSFPELPAGVIPVGGSDSVTVRVTVRANG